MWTHLSALIGFFFLMFYAYSTWLAEGSFSDKVMFLIWYLPHLHLYVAPVYLIARFADLLGLIHFLVLSSPRVISAQTLLFSSSFFHLTECMGPKVWLIGVRMDYTSISVLIVGSYFPYATICSAINPAPCAYPSPFSITRLCLPWHQDDPLPVCLSLGLAVLLHRADACARRLGDFHFHVQLLPGTCSLVAIDLLPTHHFPSAHIHSFTRYPQP